LVGAVGTRVRRVREGGVAQTGRAFLVRRIELLGSATIRHLEPQSFAEIAEKTMETEKEELNRITEAIIGAAIEVHREFGPGLLESAYEACLRFELIERGFEVESQKEMPIVYKRVTIDKGYKIDLLVNGKVIVEVKVVERLIPVHEAQLVSYLKLSG